ncbi:hypothetical protein L1887_51925 [Cichorium endivia]|nr:hypothetical protein L1887_51925 [Cichorium endivia]
MALRTTLGVLACGGSVCAGRGGGGGLGVGFDVQLQPSALHYYSGSHAIKSRFASSSPRSHRDGAVLLHLSLTTVTFRPCLANATLGPALLCYSSPSTLLYPSPTAANLRKSQESTLGRHALAIALPHTMYYERKELIQSLDLLCFVLFVYTWLLDNRTLLLLIKSALQVQFCNPLQLHPTWSLPFFVVFLACLNALLALAHLWAPASATNRGDAILIDFVGQDAAPGRLHMLGIDLCVAAVQLLMTVVAFECAKDQAKQDGEQSLLDDTTERQGEERGQGWDVRDEEAALFGLDTDDEARREKNEFDALHCRRTLTAHRRRHCKSAVPARRAARRGSARATAPTATGSDRRSTGHESHTTLLAASTRSASTCRRRCAASVCGAGACIRRRLVATHVADRRAQHGPTPPLASLSSLSSPLGLEPLWPIAHRQLSCRVHTEKREMCDSFKTFLVICGIRDDLQEPASIVNLARCFPAPCAPSEEGCEVTGRTKQTTLPLCPGSLSREPWRTMGSQLDKTGVAEAKGRERRSPQSNKGNAKNTCGIASFVPADVDDEDRALRCMDVSICPRAQDHRLLVCVCVGGVVWCGDEESRLDARGVEHDANAGSEGLGRDVVRELGTDDTRVAVRAGDAAPDDADLAATHLLGGLVDVGDALAKVELGLLGLLNTLDLDEGASVGANAVALLQEIWYRILPMLSALTIACAALAASSMLKYRRKLCGDSSSHHRTSILLPHQLDANARATVCSPWRSKAVALNATVTMQSMLC